MLHSHITATPKKRIQTPHLSEPHHGSVKDPRPGTTPRFPGADTSAQVLTDSHIRKHSLMFDDVAHQSRNSFCADLNLKATTPPKKENKITSTKTSNQIHT